MTETLWEKIKRIDKFALVKHYNPDYKVNPLIFDITLVLIVVLTLVLFNQYGWSMQEKIYLKCDIKEGCENPFYIENYYKIGKDASSCPDLELCSLSNLPFGYVYGRDASFLQKNYEWLFLGLMILAVLLNHFLYNKDYKFTELKE